MIADDKIVIKPINRIQKDILPMVDINFSEESLKSYKDSLNLRKLKRPIITKGRSIPINQKIDMIYSSNIHKESTNKICRQERSHFQTVGKILHSYA